MALAGGTAGSQLAHALGTSCTLRVHACSINEPFAWHVQIEAEALGKMAVAAGYQPVGLPQLVVQHAKVHIPPQPTW